MMLAPRLMLSFVFLLAGAAAASAETQQRIALRGHEQTLHVYGPATGPPVIVSSGDGGWMHLGPHVAELLGGQGFHVIGFDVRAYLSSFTSYSSTLAPADEPGDYNVLIDLATAQSSAQPLLIGVSEGAGLSVLAAADPRVNRRISGVIGLGLPDRNELGWRWRDSLIYLTHKLPNEPTFSAGAIVSRVAPVPLAILHSTHDEYVPFSEMQAVLAHASAPKRLWIVNASNHSFSDNLPDFDRQLLEAVAWARANRPR